MSRSKEGRRDGDAVAAEGGTRAQIPTETQRTGDLPAPFSINLFRLEHAYLPSAFLRSGGRCQLSAPVSVFFSNSRDS